MVAITSAAQITLTISGEITNEYALPITESYVKIYKAGRKAPIKYFATGAGNTFSFTLQIRDRDSLFLSVSHNEKQEYRQLIPIEEDATKLHYKVILLPKIVNLDSLVIMANPIWKNGDTSFYKADAFGNGGEKTWVN